MVTYKNIQHVKGTLFLKNASSAPCIITPIIITEKNKNFCLYLLPSGPLAAAARCLKDGQVGFPSILFPDQEAQQHSGSHSW